ncbi:cytochrome-c peroxidase [Myxococcus hansupus]|uniref:cytochrome-c peroxidase n=1 Tax=Pseudomyxococcus hansupus TaxID=1297742 RepID=UPI000272A322|nr:cytochrome c peroxidase [Myxococcus hansupus]
MTFRPALFAALLVGCTLTPAQNETLSSLPTLVPAPADNPTRPEAVELGRALFWDPILSGNRDVACATCHHPDFGYSDGLAVSVGVGGRGVGPARAEGPGARVGRNSLSVLFTAFNGLTTEGMVAPEAAPMFWDHRTVSLESQALGPLKNALEMRGSAFAEDKILDELVRRLSEIPEYVELFDAAFGNQGISDTTLAKAIAAFERTLVPTPTSFDRYLAGDDKAMTPAQIRGMHGFVAQGCARCHSGPMLSDFKLHRLPVVSDEPDLGPGTREFRTPTLRMITLTAPYMHNGSVKTLDASIDFYHNLEVTDPLLEGDVEPPLGGGDDLRAFFEALSDGTFDRTVPERVPSGLPPGGR